MLVVPLVVLAVFVGALTRATFGFGEAVVTMPLLALLPIGLHTSASLVGLSGLTVALLSLARGLHDVDRRMLARLTVGTVVGIPLGVALLLAVPAPLMSTALGTVLVGYAAYALLPKPPVRAVHARWAYPTGVLAGALGSAYNFNGVPVVVFGTLRRWRPSVFRQTLQAHFLVSGVLVVAGQALGGIWTEDLPRLFALCLPALAAATVAGHRLHRRIPGDRFARYVYVLVLVLGSVLAARGLMAR